MVFHWHQGRTYVGIDGKKRRQHTQVNFNLGHTWVTANRFGFTIEGGLYWHNNYRETYCGDITGDNEGSFAPQCANCTCDRVWQPGYGHFTYRDHCLEVNWRGWRGHDVIGVMNDDDTVTWGRYWQWPIGVYAY